MLNEIKNLLKKIKEYFEEEPTGTFRNGTEYYECPSGETMLELIKHSPSKELRFIMNREDTYWVWDSYYGTHLDFQKEFGDLDTDLRGQIRTNEIRLYNDETEVYAFYTPDHYMGFHDPEWEDEEGNMDYDRIDAYVIDRFRETDIYRELRYQGVENVTLGSQYLGTYGGKGRSEELEPLTSDFIINWSRDVQQRLGLKTFDVFLSSKNELKLSLLVVPKERRKEGLGTQAVQALCDLADRYGCRIILSPALKDDRFGTTSRARLVKFYKKFGFVENRGRSTDYSISGSMYRNPRPVM